MNVFDSRWIGAHGIGRFAAEVFRRFRDFSPLALGLAPSSPLDPLALSAYLRRHRATFFFSPGYNAPLSGGCPFVFCVHDLNHLAVPENSSRLKRAYYQLVLRPAIRRAEVVFTVSEFSRQAICEWSGCAEEHVVTVSNGVSTEFVSQGGVYSKSLRPYFLYVGNYKPHKNFSRVLRAFGRVFQGGDMELIATGSPPADVRRLVAELGLKEQVTFLGTVHDEQLASIYRGAIALVQASLYEGFGLPVAEAMACGTPVVVSRSASLPEVAGDAATYVDALNEESIADGLRRVASDTGLRQLMRQRGLGRAHQYSWEYTVSKIEQVLRDRGLC